MSRDHLNGRHERFKPLGPALSPLKPGDQIRLKGAPNWPPYTVTAVKGGEVHFERGGTRGYAPVGGVVRV
jgi:hypothetical protein